MVGSPWPGLDTPRALELGDNASNEGMKVKIHVQTLQSLDVANISGGEYGSHTPSAPAMQPGSGNNDVAHALVLAEESSVLVEQR